MNSQILIINGSIHGAAGNCGALIDLALHYLSPNCLVDILHLVQNIPFADLMPRLERAQGFLFTSGAYWDSWGSPLQKFLEDVSDTEGSLTWLGKPAAVVVTEHSVGGKEVVSRLQGVLNTFGVYLPPMTGMVVSLANQLALMKDTIGANDMGGMTADLWRPEDIEIVCHNLLTAVHDQKIHDQNRWQTWPLDSEHYREKWLKIPQR